MSKTEPISPYPRIRLGGTVRSLQDVRALHALGLQVAEIPIRDAAKFAPAVPAFAELRRELEMAYLCHGPREGDPNNTAVLQERYLPRLQGVINLMPQLQMQLLTIHLWLDRRFVKPRALDYKRELLGHVLQSAKADGICVGIENLSEGTEDLAPFMEHFPDLGITLDIGHAELLCEHNRSLDLIRNFGARIFHLHLHDNRGGTSPKDDLHLPVGEGNIRFEPIFRALKRIRYQGTLTLELRPEEIARCLPRVQELLQVAG